MAAHAKLTAQRQDRLIAIVALGESLEAAARAVGVSTTAIRKLAARDAIFSARLQAAREHGRGDAAVDEWQLAAEALERQYPARWALPSLPDWPDA